MPWYAMETAAPLKKTNNVRSIAPLRLGRSARAGSTFWGAFLLNVSS